MDWTHINALWWLAGLSIPLIIHFLSKKRQRVVKIGSTRFINPSETMSSKSIHFTQWLLFLIRALIIGCIVVIAAKPLLTSDERQNIIYVEDVIASNLDQYNSEVQVQAASDDNIIFSISGNQQPPTEFISYWTFINYLNSQSQEASVYAENGLLKFSGTSELLNPKVKWITVPRKEELITMDTVHGNDGSNLIQYLNSDEKLSYEIDETIPLYTRDTTFINILSSTRSIESKNTFGLIIQAIDNELPWKVSSAEVRDPDWVVLIDTAGSTYLANHIEFNSAEGPLQFQKIDNQYFKLSGQLDLKALTNADFLDTWSALIVSNHLNIKEKDRRQINGLPLYDKEENEPKINQASSQSIDLPLWMFLFLLIAIERFISHNNQA